MAGGGVDAHRLRADAADDARRDEQIEDGADREAADQADRHVALRILGFLRRGRHRVEADIGEEDRGGRGADAADAERSRSEEHTSELQSLMRSSYAVVCLKK